MLSNFYLCMLVWDCLTEYIFMTIEEIKFLILTYNLKFISMKKLIRYEIFILNIFRFGLMPLCLYINFAFVDFYNHSLYGYFEVTMATTIFIRLISYVCFFYILIFLGKVTLLIFASKRLKRFLPCNSFNALS